MIDMVLIFAMGISGIHFGLIYATVTGKRNNISVAKSLCFISEC